jgi:sulfide:quinone oxidoreductase
VSAPCLASLTPLTSCHSFTRLFGIDQTVPRRAFYHLKKDFFPSVYYSSFIKGTWQGPKGWSLSAPSARSFSSSARRSFSTSSAAARDQPARRPRDPLATSPHAVRHALPSGETLIVRAPPTAGTPHSSADFGARPAQPGASAGELFNVAPHAGTGVLPPPIRAPKVAAKEPELNEQEITEIRRLRAADPTLSARAL